jgi:hypothetical protein
MQPPGSVTHAHEDVLVVVPAQAESAAVQRPRRYVSTAHDDILDRYPQLRTEADRTIQLPD